jgi:hypothetical protein
MSNLKTLEDLTPEIEAKIPEYIANGLEGVFDGQRYREFDAEKARKAVKWNYEKCGYAEPKVVVVENPLEAQIMGNQLLGNKTNQHINSYLFTLNVYSDCYYQWYKFIKDEFKLPLTIEAEFEECFKLQRESGVYSAIFLDEVCIVSKYPKKVYRNENNDLHRTDGVAVVWGHTTHELDCYYINGRNMPSRLFEEEITREDFIKESNEDIKGGIYEIIESRGEGSMLEFLGAKVVDEHMFAHSDGSVETMTLYKTEEKIKGVTNMNDESPSELAWLKMVCPSTGTNYLIPSDSSFMNCVDAAKFHRPTYVPTDVDYDWSQRN